jgi:NitT/TauT family transport system ATP-binding protein
MYYGSRRVTDSVSLQIRQGEVLSIVGPSGCGKTTLLRAVAGLNAVSNGQIIVNGAEVNNTAPEGVAMVFQHFGLFPWKTVESNIAYALTVSGVDKKTAHSRACELIATVGLAGFENAYPHQLSGGMQQRTGLARALATNPQVLLMDEPFGALDAQTREVLQFELLELWSKSLVTTLFVTHSIDEAVLFGDRVAVLKGRPSRIVELIDVDLPADRDRAILISPEFIALRERVWTLVMAPDATEAEVA